jgi:hypothetical protein
VTGAVRFLRRQLGNHTINGHVEQFGKFLIVLDMDATDPAANHAGVAAADAELGHQFRIPNPLVLEPEHEVLLHIGELSRCPHRLGLRWCHGFSLANSHYVN